MTRPILLLLILLTAVPVMAQTGPQQIGNLNPPLDPYLPDLVTGQQSFAYLVRPADQLSCSEPGFRLEALHMWLAFEPIQVPVTFQVDGGLLEAIDDPAFPGPVPGAELCPVPPQTVTVDEPGLFQLTVPVQGACGCRAIEKDFFLNIRLLTPVEALLPTDGQPEPGVVFWNNGNGWEDMDGLDKAAIGKTIIWGDIVCCTNSVGREQATWGRVKALYR